MVKLIVAFDLMANSPHEVTWVFVPGRLLLFLLLFFSLLSCKKN